MELGLFQQQKLKLVMTNELRQAISILQYSSLELTEFLQKEALENPLIEIEEVSGQVRNDYRKKELQDRYDIADRIEITLQEHMTKQMSLISLNQQQKVIMSYLICSLDENGYLIEDLSVVSSECSVEIGEVEEVLELLQQMDPAGVGARGLQECLLLQLQQMTNRNELAETVIGDYFFAFADKKWKTIAKELSVSIGDLQQVSDFIQTLNPRPGQKFYNGKVHYIKPDLIVVKEEETFKISISGSASPPVSVSTYYEKMLKSKEQDELYEYVQEKYQRYLWLKKSIEQRNNTLIKVMSAIIETQSDFFYKGNGELKPLTLKEIAELTDMHESTVSRATNGKYVQTPYGLFELKSFFSTSLNTNQGDVSSAMVKQAIQDLVSQEDKQKPLSDQKLVSLLKEGQGYNVSRRTIAKYREQMNIPSSARRKRFH